RRPLVVVSALLMAVFRFGLAYAQTPAGIMVFGFAYTVISNIFSSAFHILQGEVFPTALRARAAGATYGLSRLSSAVMPFVLLPRSEEHTSELQSRVELVCRLLLEK